MVERAARRVCDGVRDGRAELEVEHTEQNPSEEEPRLLQLPGPEQLAAAEGVGEQAPHG